MPRLPFHARRMSGAMCTSHTTHLQYPDRVYKIKTSKFIGRSPSNGLHRIVTELFRIEFQRPKYQNILTFESQKLPFTKFAKKYDAHRFRPAHVKKEDVYTVFILLMSKKEDAHSFRPAPAAGSCHRRGCERVPGRGAAVRGFQMQS